MVPCDITTSPHLAYTHIQKHTEIDELTNAQTQPLNNSRLSTRRLMAPITESTGPTPFREVRDSTALDRVKRLAEAACTVASGAACSCASLRAKARDMKLASRHDGTAAEKQRVHSKGANDITHAARCLATSRRVLVLHTQTNRPMSKHNH